MTTDQQSSSSPSRPDSGTLNALTAESLRKQAKQWLKALRAGNAEALARFARAHPKAPARPGLRDVQHALAREAGFSGWSALMQQLAARAAERKEDLQPPLQRLFEAAHKGDLQRVRELLDAQPDLINVRGAMPGSFGKRTALHYGVEHAPVVNLLLERGADPNIRDDGDNAMPLHFAAEHQDLDVIRLLIEHGADPVGDGTMHELDVLGWATAWHYIEAKPEVVAYLLAHGARYSIFSAVALGAVDAIRELVARNPTDLERPMDAANNRRRPLHLAIIKKQSAALETLLALGADTEARDRVGLTPLDQAALANEPDYVQTLLAHRARIELPAAVALGRMAGIERLLAADPHCLEPGGRWASLIVRAAEKASAQVVETLLRCGASPNAIDETGGATPLHYAAFRGNVDAVRVLLAHGADPTRREPEHGSTPLGWAAFAGQEETRQLLLNVPFDIFDAITSDREARVNEIIDADPQALDRSYGEFTGLQMNRSWATPMFAAVAQNKPAMVRLLLARGARVVAAPDGETLLEHAQKQGYEAVADLLRERESVAPPHQRVWEEAERAVRNGQVDVLERLLEGNEDLFRTGDPPAVTPGGLAPDYSAMDAKEIIWRNHAFDSWESYAEFARQIQIALSTETHFEAAADAIVKGRIEDLRWILHSRPDLVQARSARRHHALLIDYTSPKGVEYFRQLTPPNAPEVERLLLAALRQH